MISHLLDKMLESSYKTFSTGNLRSKEFHDLILFGRLLEKILSFKNPNHQTNPNCPWRIVFPKLLFRREDLPLPVFFSASARYICTYGVDLPFWEASQKLGLIHHLESFPVNLIFLYWMIIQFWKRCLTENEFAAPKIILQRRKSSIWFIKTIAGFETRL